MKRLASILQRAKASAFYLWLLNQVLNRVIPFNRGHRFRIQQITDDSLVTRLPYITRNFNHIRGLHACALATISEFTTGFMLISKLEPTRYRLIMQRLEMDYHYQGKMDATATFTVTQEWLQEKVFNPLLTQESVLVPCEIKIHDVAGNHLTTGRVYWQIKEWQKVKTKA
jgi:hypothetical protein